MPSSMGLVHRPHDRQCSIDCIRFPVEAEGDEDGRRRRRPGINMYAKAFRTVPMGVHISSRDISRLKVGKMMRKKR
jgi:hypothetical protein